MFVHRQLIYKWLPLEEVANILIAILTMMKIITRFMLSRISVGVVVMLVAIIRCITPVVVVILATTAVTIQATSTSIPTSTPTVLPPLLAVVTTQAGAWATPVSITLLRPLNLTAALLIQSLLFVRLVIAIMRILI